MGLGGGWKEKRGVKLFDLKFGNIIIMFGNRKISPNKNDSDENLSYLSRK